MNRGHGNGEREGDNDGGKSKEMNDYRAVQKLFS